MDRRRMRAAAVVLAALLVTTGSALAQDNDRLSGLLLSRIEDDSSGACVQAARVDLAAATPVQVAAACADRLREARPALGARFEIGSISKAFVGVLAADMVARGELRLDESLAALLPPTAAVAREAVPDVTLADLLTHHAGLPRLPPGFRPADPADPYADLQPGGVYGPLAQVKLPQPRRYAYSNWAFLMLSDLLAQRAGQPFDALLHSRVLAPLGMHDTLVARNDGLVPGRQSNGRPAATWNVPVAFAGAGGLRSTVDDLVIFARALLGEVPAGTPESLRTALRVSREKLRDGDARVDLAWAWHLLRQPGGAPLLFHNGMTAGFSSMLVVDLERRRAAVVLADAAGGFDDLALRLVDGSTPLAPARKPAALDATTAQAVTGRYALAPGLVVTVSLEGGRLYAQATGQGRFELLRDARGDFYTLVTDLMIRFDGLGSDGDGRATGLTLFQGGGILPARRID
jgi:serine-type D-Ala-D-Ala carboxypeptidase/endopeptidase